MFLKKMKLLLAILIVQNIYAQNLFVNGGFESYYNCPTTTDQSNQAIDVVSKFDSPDFYNCSFLPTQAFSGTGSMYLGAVKYTNSVTREGILMKMNQAMSPNIPYFLSLMDKYGYKYPNTGFNQNLYNDCYKLGFKFLTSNTLPSYPITYDYILNPEILVGNSTNPTYQSYSFTFTPTQAYTYLLIQTIPSAKTMANHVDCQITVFFNLIDDVFLVPLSVLGVELVDFQIEENESYTRFYWTTSSERNNSFFTLYSSDDLVTWHNILQTSGNNSNNYKHYMEQYDNTSLGVKYYKLTQTDFNGVETELSLLKSMRSSQQTTLVPNPAKDEISLFMAEKQKIKYLSISNILGESILNLHPADIENQSISISNLTLGTYLLHIVYQNGKNEILRFIKN